MTKQSEFTDVTRRAFIEAFCFYYQQAPIERITVKELAQKAGYSRSTFYNYFTDPYDLLNYIENDFICSIYRQLSAIGKDKLLDNFVFHFINVMTENELYRQTFLSRPVSMQFINRLKSKAIPLFLQIFEISPDNKKAVYTIEFYIPGVISLISSWMQNEHELPIENLAEVVRGILKDGVLAQLQ